MSRNKRTVMIAVVMVLAAGVLGVYIISYKSSLNSLSDDMIKNSNGESRLLESQALLKAEVARLEQADPDQAFRITDEKILKAIDICSRSEDQESIKLLASLSTGVDATKVGRRSFEESIRASTSHYPAKDALAGRKHAAVYLVEKLEQENGKSLRNTLRLQSLIHIIGYDLAHLQLSKRANDVSSRIAKEDLLKRIAELELMNPKRGSAN